MTPRNQARNEASEKGESKFQGPPCKHGHIGIRYTRNYACVDCVDDWSNPRRPAIPAKAERIAALNAGARHYQGADCVRKHGGLRYVSSGCCVTCAKLKDKRAA